ncbi:hypothetical protein [Staphylococcus aureus]|nr:hypothetical protein [Staphylococcus aureus]
MSRCLVEKTIFLESRKQKDDVSEDDAISPAEEDNSNDKSISDDDLPF